jgi:hypothetical protein
MSEDAKHEPQDESSAAEEAATQENAVEESNHPAQDAEQQVEASGDDATAPKRSKGPLFISLLALLLASLSLAYPWLAPVLGITGSSDQGVSVEALNRAQQASQSALERLDDAQQSLQRSLQQQNQAWQQADQTLGGELDQQRQALSRQLQRLEQRLNSNEEALLALRGELDRASQAPTKTETWSLQEAHRLLRRGAADWALQPNAQQALMVIDQALQLTEGEQATGLGALRQRLENQHAALQQWQNQHGNNAENWQQLAERLSALQPNALGMDLGNEPASEEAASWRQRLSNGLGRLVKVERDTSLEPELWDQQSRDSLQLLMQQSLLLAETAHRRGEDASRHVRRLEQWLNRLHGDSVAAQTWLQDLQSQLAAPPPPNPEFAELAERMLRIREALEPTP